MYNNEALIITTKSSVLYKIRRKAQLIACDFLGQETMTRIYFRHLLGYTLNLDNPVTFNEKICWYKINYCPNDELVVRCADKFYVREYLEGKGLGGYLVDIVGVWDNPQEIIWKELPKKFAIKRTNGCGYNIICLDKNQVSEKHVKRLLTKWQKEKFGKYNIEPHYDVLDSKIICEKYIESEDRLPVDYKVHCFNGKPEFIMVCDGRLRGKTSFGYFDLHKTFLPYAKSQQTFNLDITQQLLDEMVRISEVIACDFPFVRVDFYFSKGKLFIGELTFTPTAGYDFTITRDGDNEMGKLFDLSGIQRRRNES